MNSESEAKPFLNVRETAKLLDVHENTVRNWVAAGTLISARVPGSKQHRFAHGEVLRLRKERGAAASSVAPALRTDGPELVTASELNAWAGREDAKGAFPELMRRLLAATPGITDLEVRTHEGVAAPSWDGTAMSRGSTYLPSGELRLEFGTDQNPKGKAQSDFDKRVLALPSDANATFVFASPRNWAGAREWAVDRAAEGKFAGVKAIDAHTLEGWLHASPSVHYWISERLGYLPRDAQTIDRWWRSFQGRTTVSIPSNFFGAGRDAEAEELRAALTGAGSSDTIVAVQAPWHDEALAFVYSTLEVDEALLHRAIVVTDDRAWQRLIESAEPLVLIPLFAGDPDLASAVDCGHRVILIAESGDVIRNAKKIELKKIDRPAARDALKPSVPDRDTAEAMVALARRSMPALIRSIAREPRLKAPEWAKNPEQAAILGPLVLAGSWTSSESDLGTVEKLTGRSRDDVERQLRSLALRSDAPFVRSGGLWRVTSPAEAALILIPTLTNGNLLRWSDVVLEVLLEPDPFAGMDTVEQLATRMRGGETEYSETLRKGLASGLALAAASDEELPSELAMQRRVNEIVYRLLESANSDTSGATWARLASVLPTLAESSPEVFQDAVELDLDRAAPVLRTLFRDSGADTSFGSSSPHPSLLWALETLCWSPNYFGRSAVLLGRLSSMDPGGRLSNRPIESLQNVTAGWLSQSGASIDEKLAIIGRLVERDTDVGWKLVLRVWPSRRAVAFSPHGPTYRDWTPTSPVVTFADWGRFVHGLVELAIAAASSEAVRWKDLITNVDELPGRERDVVLAKLREIIDAQTWTTEEQYIVWEALSSEADRHEEYPEATWALPADNVAAFRALASAVAPARDGRRYSNLFDWHPHVPDLKLGDENYRTELARLRHHALTEVLTLGPDALRLLAIEVNVPQAVGHILGTIADVDDQEVLGWLNSAELNLRQAALAFVSSKVSAKGMAWLTTVLASPALSDAEPRANVMASVPFTREFWTQVPTLGAELELAYWKGAQHYQAAAVDRADAVRLLLEHGRPWEASALVSAMLHENQAPDVEVIRAIFNSIRFGVEPLKDSTMSGYHVGKILDYLERRVPEDVDLPAFEFMFFELVHDHEPSGALFRALGSDPTQFVNMVSAIFRGEGEPKRNPTAQEQAFAHLSFSVLNEWRKLPGLADDGTIDGNHLMEWVRAARLALSDNGRASIGDEQIGQVLASSPVGSDGVWPAEAVREVIENVGNARIDTGLHIGRTNQRGVTSRGIFDGGDQERELEKDYREMAAQISTRWPRTARVLRNIADSYQHEARRNDARAERMGDDG
jgi:hypothetical protein